ncbi:BET1 homolog [Drosophila obscura]|uniref:BET1 homolog n=1 Tax=Drosophila obscura TaxID=7282 RepID=UPI001BB0FD44|nr:BET1 homolog [Drosophila obscura]
MKSQLVDNPRNEKSSYLVRLWAVKSKSINAKLAHTGSNMRRTNNYPYQPLNQQPSGSSPVGHDALEAENERAAEELKQKIGALKSLTIDIGNEVRYQDKLLRGIDDDMDRTSGFLGNTMTRVVRLAKQGGGARQMCYMFLFVLVVFLLLWLTLKFK